MEDHLDIDGAAPPDSSTRAIRLITCVCCAHVSGVVLIGLHVVLGRVCSKPHNVDVPTGRVHVKGSTVGQGRKPSEH